MGCRANMAAGAFLAVCTMVTLTGCGIPAKPASESRWWNGNDDGGYAAQPEPAREPVNVPELADTWVGATEQELVSVWGNPDRYVDSPDNPWTGYFYGNRRMTQFEPGYKPGTLHDVTFWIDDEGIVRGWKHQSRWRGRS